MVYSVGDVCDHRQNQARAHQKPCFISGFLLFALMFIIGGAWYVLNCENSDTEFCNSWFAMDDDAYEVLAWVFLLCVAMLIAMGTYARCGIRRRFGLPGSDFEDCLLWTCCCPCALCQESRTLQVNNVQGGEWYGPAGPPVLPIQTMASPPVGRPYMFQHYQPPPIVPQPQQQPTASAPPAPGIPFLEAQAPPFEKV